MRVFNKQNQNKIINQLYEASEPLPESHTAAGGSGLSWPGVEPSRTGSTRDAREPTSTFCLASVQCRELCGVQGMEKETKKPEGEEERGSIFNFCSASEMEINPLHQS